MSNGYQNNLSIDRIDVNKNYNPENCRWTTAKKQARNRRTNKLITFNNETRCIAEWAEIYNMKPDTLYYRLKQEWTIEKAFTIPVKMFQ